MLQTKTPRAKSPTKTEIYAELAEAHGLTRKQIGEVIDGLARLIGKNLGRKGNGVITLPGIAKFKIVRKPATPARKGINPFTGEETTFKAKPARNVIKIQPVKALKEMV